MESGWIINFKDGFKIILTEEEYKIYDKHQEKEDVATEEHWFSLQDARNKNPHHIKDKLCFVENGKEVFLGGEKN